MHRKGTLTSEVPELAVPHTRKYIPAVEEKTEADDDDSDYRPSDDDKSAASFGVTFKDNSTKKKRSSVQKRKRQSKSPPASILKPPSPRAKPSTMNNTTPSKRLSSGETHRGMTMEDLSNQFNGISMGVLPVATSAGLGAPLLMGTWQEEDNDLSNLEPEPPQTFIIL